MVAKLLLELMVLQKKYTNYSKEKNLLLFDLTCPKVLKIHEEASKLSKEGYFIILIAQRDHPEAIGTISFCGDESVVLENESQLDDVVNMINCLKRTKLLLFLKQHFRWISLIY